MTICRTAVSRCRSRSVGCADIISQPITRRCVVHGIVSKGRPQLVMNSNRIARANKLGAAPLYARLQTCDAASSAYNTWDGSVAKPRREIRKSSRSWEWVGPLSTDDKERGNRRVSNGPSARLALAQSVRRGLGVKIGKIIFALRTVRGE